MKEGDALQRREIIATEKFSLAPARYTEASLVKKLEDLGIGRPSTYAPTISTIQQREYVVKGGQAGRGTFIYCRFPEGYQGYPENQEGNGWFGEGQAPPYRYRHRGK